MHLLKQHDSFKYINQEITMRNGIGKSFICNVFARQCLSGMKQNVLLMYVKQRYYQTRGPLSPLVHELKNVKAQVDSAKILSNQRATVPFGA